MSPWDEHRSPVRASTHFSPLSRHDRSFRRFVLSLWRLHPVFTGLGHPLYEDTFPRFLLKCHGADCSNATNLERYTWSSLTTFLFVSALRRNGCSDFPPRQRRGGRPAFRGLSEDNRMKADCQLFLIVYSLRQKKNPPFSHERQNGRASFNHWPRACLGRQEQWRLLCRVSLELTPCFPRRAGENCSVSGGASCAGPWPRSVGCACM